MSEYPGLSRIFRILSVDMALLREVPLRRDLPVKAAPAKRRRPRLFLQILGITDDNYEVLLLPGFREAGYLSFVILNISRFREIFRLSLAVPELPGSDR